MSSPSTVYRLPSTYSRRSAFTLIELLVAITIIGLLAAMALGGMYRANVSAKQTNTKTTVTKVAAQLQEIWESYRNRRLPIDPKQVLLSTGKAPYTMQYNYATGSNGYAPGWLPYFASIRQQSQWGGPLASEPLLVASPSPLYANNVQIAALRLAATRELMRLELPCKFADFTSDYTQLPQSPTDNRPPPVQTLLIPQPTTPGAPPTPLANPGGLSEQYRQFYRANATSANTTFESAECLYMIIKFASQNELGQKNITDDPRLVGDVDGDGMPEIQDAFVAGMFTPVQPGSPYSQHNNPIAFIRWPAGFVSDVQPGPTGAQYQTANPSYEYAASRHDIFDPLRIDPRAFTIAPLVFSSGVDATFDVWEHNAFTNLTPTQQLFAQNDPYYTDNSAAIFPIIPNTQSPTAPQNPLPGTVMDLGTTWPGGSAGSGGYADNITNHQLGTRVK